MRTKQLNGEIGAAADRVRHARGLWRRAQPRQSLRDLLLDAAPGISRCMYCGDNQGTDIDHHEPLSRNPLRTFDWLNHLLACSFCNSHGKGDQFPVDGRGQSLLIDPTVDDPADHLALALSVGEYRPRTDKGHHTIAVLRLNRAVLVEGRQQARRVIELALPGWHDAMRLGDPRRMNECLLTIRMQPFAEVITAMLLAAVQPGAEVVFRHDPRLLRILLEPRLRASLLN
ncbi:hypothetical protein KUA19_02775 [Catellatospora sp. NEAU-YM18]|nr:hypothetical protein [Catellatospora tritici]